MARRPKSWSEKMISPPPHVEVTEKPFAGIPPGTKMLISSPVDIAAFVKERLAPGQTMSVQELRLQLAKASGAQAACPLTTSIFLRIVSEAAWDELEAGAEASGVTPFWRVVDPTSELARKLRCGSTWIAEQRAAELE